MSRIDTRVDSERMYFSTAQYEYLAKMFPESVGESKAHHEYVFKDGQRSVVLFIKSRVRE